MFSFLFFFNFFLLKQLLLRLLIENQLGYESNVISFLCGSYLGCVSLNLGGSLM